MGRDLDDRYFTLGQLVQYSGLSLGTLRRHLKTPDRPLPHYRLRRRILIRKSEFDRWLRDIGGTSTNVPGPAPPLEAALAR